jgi:RNA polymerase sigma-70 factor (ECF subfamily)
MGDEFLERHRAAIFARVRGWTVNDAEAEDLTQETLLRAHRGRHTLEDRQAALAWVLRIADRVRIDRFRRRDPLNKATLELEGIGLRDDAPTGFQMAAQNEMSACTRNYVEMLKPSQRRVLHLHDVEGRDLVEIAAALGVSEGAAKIRLHRARKKLKTLLDGACRFSHDERGVFVCEPKNSP